MREFSRALVTSLDADATLQTLLRGGLPQANEVPALERSDRPNRDWRVWEASTEVHNIFSQAGDRWLTFEIVADDAEPAEQTENIRDLAFHMHVWCRETDSDPADLIDEYLRRSINRLTLSGPSLHAWWLLEDPFYVREFDPEIRSWHIVRRYGGLFTGELLGNGPAPVVPVSAVDDLSIIEGVDDPSAGAGTAADLFTWYQRSNGELWYKSGIGNMSWTRIG